MGNLKVRHIVEATLWLLLVAVLYAGSFEFDREIEIYKFGASSWPRVILLLVAVAALGQLAYHWRGAQVASGMAEAAADDGAEEAARSRAGLKWYLWTFFLLALPFAYMILPQWLQSRLADPSALHAFKLGCAGALLPLYALTARGNVVGAMLALPVFFGALMQDFGFYSLAPFFAVGVMYLMGERRAGQMVLIAAVIMGLMLMLFVSVLYVGLPTGNISPFYDIGTGLVNILQ